MANCLVDTYAHESFVESLQYQRQRRADLFVTDSDTGLVQGRFSIKERSPSQTEVSWSFMKSTPTVGDSATHDNADRCAMSVPSRTPTHLTGSMVTGSSPYHSLQAADR